MRIVQRPNAGIQTCIYIDITFRYGFFFVCVCVYVSECVCVCVCVCVCSLQRLKTAQVYIYMCVCACANRQPPHEPGHTCVTRKAHIFTNSYHRRTRLEII